MRIVMALIALMVLVAGPVGCATAIKESVGVARGAKGIYAPIRTAGRGKALPSLAAYGRVELGEITDDFGKVPPGFVSLLRQDFAERLTESDLPNRPGGKTLVIRAKLVHYESQELVGVALGPLEEVVARAELLDKDSGEVLGVANCIGRTTERVNVGVTKKAEGLSKAFISWVESGYGETDD